MVPRANICVHQAALTAVPKGLVRAAEPHPLFVAVDVVARAEVLCAKRDHAAPAATHAHGVTAAEDFAAAAPRACAAEPGEDAEPLAVAEAVAVEVAGGVAVVEVGGACKVDGAGGLILRGAGGGVGGEEEVERVEGVEIDVVEEEDAVELDGSGGEAGAGVELLMVGVEGCESEVADAVEVFDAFYAGFASGEVDGGHVFEGEVGAGDDGSIAFLLFSNCIKVALTIRLTREFRVDFTKR